jgi:Putative lumazine-binding
MRRPLLALAALALLVAAPLRAQTAADSSGVRAAAMDYLDGFYTGDSTLHIRSIRPEVYKFGFWRARDSVRYAAGEQMKWDEFHAFTRRVKARGQAPNPSWRKDVQLLDVLDQTAAAKVTAWWGTDYLLMGKFDGRWMITHVLWQSFPPRATAAR